MLGKVFCLPEIRLFFGEFRCGTGPFFNFHFVLVDLDLLDFLLCVALRSVLIVHPVLVYVLAALQHINIKHCIYLPLLSYLISVFKAGFIPHLNSNLSTINLGIV